MNEKSLEVEVSNRQTLIKERRFILLSNKSSKTTLLIFC